MKETATKKETCPKCHGSGETTYCRGNHSSVYRMGMCSKCLGAGEVEKNELHEAIKADFKAKFPHRLDFEREVMNHPEPKTARELAMKWFSKLTADEKQLRSNAYMDANGQPRRHWQSLTGREIENIYANSKK